MKDKQKCVIFIAHAEGDHALGEAIKNLFVAALDLDSKQVFLSSDRESIEFGKWDPQVTQALGDAKVVVALMTPRSVWRPWPVFEAGGANFRGKALFVLLANGIVASTLPAPLRAWHAEDLKDPQVVTKLVAAVGVTLDTSVKTNADDLISTVTEHATPRAGDWSIVSAPLLGESLGHSPFNLDNLLDLREPTHLFLAGPTLFHLTRDENAWHYQDVFWTWLTENTQRSLRILLCDQGQLDMVEAWTSFAGPKYPCDLKHSTSVFQRWQKQAKEDHLDVVIKVTDLVSVGATFLDPKDRNRGTLVLVPITTKEFSAERPHLMLTLQEHQHVFDYYWNDFDLLFTRARNLAVD